MNDYLDFSSMTDGELLEIVNASSGRYQQELVDGAKKELAKRGGDNVLAERQPTRYEGGMQPPVLLKTVSGRKLFATEQIAVASLLGPPIAGCVLMALNYRALGNAWAAWQPLVVGVAATILIFILALFLPEKLPHFVLPAVSCLAMYSYGKQQQGDALDNYLRAGGRKGSWVIMVGVSVGCTVISLILFIAIAITLGIEPPAEETSQPVAKIERNPSRQRWATYEVNHITLNNFSGPSRFDLQPAAKEPIRCA
jgi:hypothetical protein